MYVIELFGGYTARRKNTNVMYYSKSSNDNMNVLNLIRWGNSQANTLSALSFMPTAFFPFSSIVFALDAIDKKNHPQ